MLVEKTSTSKLSSTLAFSTTQYDLQQYDKIQLIEELEDSWWLADINGRRAKVLIAHVRVKRQSKRNVKESLQSSNNSPTVKEEEVRAREPSSSTPRRRRHRSIRSERLREGGLSRQVVAAEVNDLSIDLNLLRTEAELIIKAFEQDTGVKMKDARLMIKESPDERMYEKMLENPYEPLFEKHKQLSDSIALAPARPLFYRELLLPDLNVNTISEEERKKLMTLEFDVLQLKDANQEKHMQTLLMSMFYELGLVSHFKIPDATLARRYRDVPFHNFYHASNVTQTLYYFLTTCQAERILGPLELLALLVAALCHDLDHPGLNNDFQQKAQTRVARLHKKSILENHHYIQCMAALSKPETNILVNLNDKDEEKVYNYLRDLILATDLAIHGIILKSLTERKQILHRIWRTGKPSDLTEEDRKIVICSLLKCADLSSEIRKNEVSKRWAKAVNEEFFKQSDKERELELPITPFMDKHKIIMSKEEVNFIEKLCMPLYGQLSQVFPSIEECCRQLEENRDVWQQRLRLFFSDNTEEMKRLSNRSVWERDQVKSKGSTLSSILNTLASGFLPKPHKNRSSNQVPPVSTTQGAVASSAAALVTGSPKK